MLVESDHLESEMQYKFHGSHSAGFLVVRGQHFGRRCRARHGAPTGRRPTGSLGLDSMMMWSGKTCMFVMHGGRTVPTFTFIDCLLSSLRAFDAKLPPGADAG